MTRITSDDAGPLAPPAPRSSAPRRLHAADLLRLPARWRRVLLVAWDCLAWLVALVAFSAVRYDLVLTPAQWRWTVLYTGLAIALQVTVGLATQVYRGRSRTGSSARPVGWAPSSCCPRCPWGPRCP